MKTLIIFAFCVTTSLCFIKSATGNEIPNFNMDEALSPEDLQKLEELVAKEKDIWEKKKLQDVSSSAIIDEFLDRLLENVKVIIIKNGIDPTSLPDERVNIGIGHTDLTEGQLNDTSTIQRYEDATISYDEGSRQLTAEMVLRFEDLKFIYKYHTKVTIISMTGHLHGDIEHIHIHVKLGFDFNEYKMFVDSIDFKHTGDINITFSGNGAVDWIINAMSKVLTTILHDLILSIVKNIVESPINALVDAINKIFHPTSFIL